MKPVLECGVFLAKCSLSHFTCCVGGHWNGKQKVVARSMHVKMKWYFFLDSGSGPTMSTANLSSLSVIISGWHNGALVPPDLLLSWHFLQSRMCFWTSLLSPGLILAVLCCWAMCLELQLCKCHQVLAS